MVLAFDADDSGQSGRDRLRDMLTDAGAGERVLSLDVPRRWEDLNGWLQGAWRSFDDEFGVALAEAGAAPTAPVANPELAVTAAPEPVAIDV